MSEPSEVFNDEHQDRCDKAYHLLWQVHELLTPVALKGTDYQRNTINQAMLSISRARGVLAGAFKPQDVNPGQNNNEGARRD